ncbi:UNVERIFIED_CONTAM: hypothetical protein LK11_05785 [Mumia flava]
MRVQLVVVVDLLVLLALVISAFATNVILERSLTQRVDDRLAEQARVFALRGTPGVNGPSGPGPRQLPSEFFVQWYDAQGYAVARLADPQLDSADYPELPDEITPADGGPGDPMTVESADGTTRWRVVYAESEDGTVAVALDIDDVAATMTQLRWIETLIALVVLAALAAVSWAVVRAALRPLSRVEHTAEAIAGGDLTARVPDDLDPRTEVGALSASLNTMLARIEDAVRTREEAARDARESEDRMRRFVADASHELRTPLTSIRGFAELYGRGGAADEATTDRFMARIEQEATRMGVLVEDLLLLARLDQQRPLRRELVDLREIACDAAEDIAVTNPDRPVAGPERDGVPVPVIGDEDRLRQVVGNLVGNVLVHTPEGTVLRIEVEPRTDRAVLVVADDGPGMTTEQSGRAFERFYRADPSRNRADGGSGLGLAIVSALVAGHGGEVAIDTAPGDGTSVTVTLPLVERPPAG